jgi:hypothetical protein
MAPGATVWWPNSPCDHHHHHHTPPPLHHRPFSPSSPIHQPPLRPPPLLPHHQPPLPPLLLPLVSFLLPHWSENPLIHSLLPSLLSTLHPSSRPQGPNPNPNNRTKSKHQQVMANQSTKSNQIKSKSTKPNPKIIKYVSASSRKKRT